MLKSKGALTRETIDTFAVEHLGFFDLAGGSVLAGVWHARIVAALAHAWAVQNAAAILLQVIEQVVDVQHADAAHQARWNWRPLLYTARTNQFLSVP